MSVSRPTAAAIAAAAALALPLVGVPMTPLSPALAAAADTTAPSIPTESFDGVESDVTDTSIVVRWGASTDEAGGSGLDYYDVWYEDLHFKVPAGTTNYKLTGLGPDSDYDVFVTAYDKAGNKSLPLYLAYTTRCAGCTPIPATPAPGTPTPTVKPATPTPTPTVKPATPTPTPTVVPATPTPTPTVKPATPTPTPTVKPATPTPTPTVVPATPTPTVKPATPTPTPTVVPATPTPTVKPATPTPTPTVVPATPTPTVKPVTPTVAPATPTPTVKPATPTPTSGPTVALSYNIDGYTTIDTLTKGWLALSGKIDMNLNTGTGRYQGNLSLNDTTGELKALGFVPVTAKIGFVPTISTTGTLVNGKLGITTAVNIYVKSAKIFGVTIAGGNTCRTASPTIINIKSIDTFDPTRGGSLLGSYSISNLTGCGLFTSLLSPLTAGAGNTISLELSKS